MVTNFKNGDNVWFTSDTHFYHKNILKYQKRPFSTIEEMNEELIRRWNSKIGKDDIVFHLGDFAFCNSSEFSNLLDRLNGNIILVKGNHDERSIKQKFKDKFFGIVYQLYIQIEDYKIYLNHFPFQSFPNTHNRIQLHGHVHSINSKYKDNKYDVGVDNNDFYPVSWSEIKQKIEYKPIWKKLFLKLKNSFSK